MKKNKVLMLMMLTLCTVMMLGFIVLLSSCSLLRQTKPSAGSTDDSASPSVSAAPSDSVTPEQPSAGGTSPTTPVTEEASPSESAAPSPSETPAGPYQLQDKAYKKAPFDISYPQVTGLGDTKLQADLNELLSEAALRDIPALKNDAALREYELQGIATYNRPDLLSVYYIGYKNLRDTAYSTQFLYTQIVDVRSRQKVQLKDLIKINKSFVQLMLNGDYSAMAYDMTSDQATSIKLYLNESGEDYWLTELKNADSPTSNTVAYLTKDALVISVSVPHALGDHIEITLPYKDLEKYKTRSQVWDILLGGGVS
jgi:hypothetical protein